MTDQQKIEELERIVAEYASFYGLTQRARRYFARESEKAQRQASPHAN